MERKLNKKAILVSVLFFVFILVSIFFIGFFKSDSKYIAHKAVRKIKNLVYYEATIHNPDGDFLPDWADDYILGKIKGIFNN